MTELDLRHLPNLHGLVGAKVRYEGTVCCVVEILDEPLALVLEPIDGALVIHADAYGQASELGQDNRLVHVIGPDHESLSDDLLGLELLD